MAVAARRQRKTHPEYFTDEVAELRLARRAELGLTAQEVADRAIALAKQDGVMLSLNERTVRDWEKRREDGGHKPEMGPRIRYACAVYGITTKTLRDLGKEP